jgi:hypothetical protein
VNYELVRFVSKLAWSILIYSSKIFLEGEGEKTEKTHPAVGRELNPAPFDYEAEPSSCFSGGVGLNSLKKFSTFLDV